MQCFLDNYSVSTQDDLGLFTFGYWDSSGRYPFYMISRSQDRALSTLRLRMSIYAYFEFSDEAELENLVKALSWLKPDGVYLYFSDDEECKVYKQCMMDVLSNYITTWTRRT